MICLTFQSCQEEDDGLVSNDLNEFSSKEAQLIAGLYIELHGGEYVLNLSSRDAYNLGISETDYEKLINEITQLNEALSSVKNDPDNELVLVDPRNVQIEDFRVRLKSGTTEEADNEPEVRGSLSLSDTGIPSSVQVYIPSEISTIYFTGSTPCAGSAFTITVSGGGGSVTKTMSSFLGVAKCTITPPVSGSNVTIKAETLCSGGGTVTYAW
ncbi:hypothetical protein [Mangrovibacterium marinum]|uniref:hypothetical protein n=1 Tax=Mangrovibacterium marinum TaxID=1639118 RepID=UPI002A188F39|nr:hypothetical protein [Mangrovibacterium marinum]